MVVPLSPLSVAGQTFARLAGRSRIRSDARGTDVVVTEGGGETPVVPGLLHFDRADRNQERAMRVV
jgi:hypothetical protein